MLFRHRQRLSFNGSGYGQESSMVYALPFEISLSRNTFKKGERKTMNRDIISFEEAKKLSLKKWKTIKSRISNIWYSLGDDCGFCERIDLLYPNYDDRKCQKCEAQKPCRDDIYPINDALADAINFTETLIKKIEALKEKKP